jgi:hypothetical protein
VPLDGPARAGLREHFRGAVWSESTETLLLPVPDGADVDVVSWLRERVAQLPATAGPASEMRPLASSRPIA